MIEEAKRAGKTLSADELQAIQDTARSFTTTVPGTYDTLPEGTRFEAHQSNYPNVIYGEYVKACVRGWSAGQGMSYPTLGNDLEAVNYSSARVGIIDEREMYRVDQAWLITHLHKPVHARWLSELEASVARAHAGVALNAQLIEGEPQHAYVTFTAHWRDASGAHSHRERSAFVRNNGNWYFIDPTVELKLGRNDACPCASGLKFKKCCASYF